MTPPGHTQLGRGAPAPHCPWKTSPSSVRSTRVLPSPHSSAPSPPTQAQAAPLTTRRPTCRPLLPDPQSQPPAPPPPHRTPEGPGGPRAPLRLGTKALHPPPPRSRWSLLKRHLLTALLCRQRLNCAWSHRSPASPCLCVSRPRNCIHTVRLPNMLAASPGTSCSPGRLPGGGVFHVNLET